MRTEDQVRDDANIILGLENTETAKAGVGQITSFGKLLGIKGDGANNRPDGWYFPNETSFPAIIAEFKAEDKDLKQQHIDELLKNCKVAHSKYKNVIGILYNGIDILVYKNEELLSEEKELLNKEHYLGLFAQNTIDKQKIFNLTKRINDNLHFKFGINDLKDRMIFTACALVAKRNNADLTKGMPFTVLRAYIIDNLSKSFVSAIQKNVKLDILLQTYSAVQVNNPENQEAIDDFIECISAISDNINSDFWQGEDVMAIFFNEFNRYKGKSEQGQVFTPDHITSLMYRLIHIDKDDIVLDAACGSGAFLVKAMCNMIKDAGGNNTDKAKEIKQNQLYGIEIDKKIFALACANMLIHKDGKTNLENLDSSTPEAAKWIVSKHVTKVLMNPPFESKYGCLDIVQNVLEHVTPNTLCAFIMPDKKLEKDRKGKKLLKKHTLLKIIKLPEKIFDAGVTTSIFIFQAQKPQHDKEIFACYMADDGLETVKNQGRQDIRDRWQAIEDRWVEIIDKQSGDDTIQWLKPSEHLSYQMPEKPFEIYEEDFVKTMMDYELFRQGIDVKEFNEQLLQQILYSSEVTENDTTTQINLSK